MRGVALRVAANHLRRHWRATLLLSVVAALLGGAAVAALVGARRTDTAYDRLAASVDFPDVAVQLVLPEDLDRAGMAEAPGVERAWETSFTVGLVGDSRNIVLLPVQAGPSDFQPFQVVEGRLPDPDEAGEVTVSERMASEFDLAVGDTFRHRALDEEEWVALLDDTWDGSATGLTLELEVVGITRTPLDSVTDGSPTMFGSNAYYEALRPTAATPRTVWFDLAPEADAAAVVAAAGLEEAGPVLAFATDREAVDQATSVLVNGLLVLGAVAVAATLAVLAQIGSRHADRSEPTLRILSDLGLTRTERRQVTLLSVAPMATASAVGTAAVAVIASRWTPIGVARRIEPDPGLSVHVPAVLAGAALVGVLVALAALIASRTAQIGRGADGGRPAARSASHLAALLAAGPIGTVGLGLTDDRGRLASARRVAALGVGAGAVGLLAAASFAASLDDLVTEPHSWGQVADYEVNLPEPVRPKTLAALDAAEEVEAYAEVVGDTVDVAGYPVTAFWQVDQAGSIAPVVVDGRVPATSAEIALGPALLDRVGLALGDTVEVDGALKSIVGIALTPRSGDSGYADGAVVGGAPEGDSDSRYTQAMIRFREGVDEATVADELFGELEYGPITRPVEIDNLAGLRPMLPLVVAVLAAVGLVALAHLGLATASRSRRDLAVLRAMGMRPRQLFASVILATTLLAATGSLIMLPAVVILVRATWRAALAATDLLTGLDVSWLVPALLVPITVLVLATGAVAGARALRGPVSRTLRPE